MSKRGRGGAAGNKFRMTLGLPVGAVINCADNTGVSFFLVAVEYYFTFAKRAQLTLTHIQLFFVALLPLPLSLSRLGGEYG